VNAEIHRFITTLTIALCAIAATLAAPIAGAQAAEARNTEQRSGGGSAQHASYVVADMGNGTYSFGSSLERVGP
jgi:hypothetical protein